MFRKRIGMPFTGLLFASVLSLSAAACAAERAQDYRFEVLDQPVSVGAHSEFNVKVTTASGAALPQGATVSRADLTMTMDGVGHKTVPPAHRKTKMGGEVKLLETPAPGVYLFMGDVSMPGTWRVDLTVQVPGEPDPVTGSATFRAER